MILKGITQKGKNRLREHGDSWWVIRIQVNVMCLNNEEGVLIQSHKTDYVMWIKALFDTDFLIVGD